jgi:hypothetical protein
MPRQRARSFAPPRPGTRSLSERAGGCSHRRRRAREGELPHELVVAWLSTTIGRLRRLNVWSQSTSESSSSDCWRLTDYVGAADGT